MAQQARPAQIIGSPDARGLSLPGNEKRRHRGYGFSEYAEW